MRARNTAGIAGVLLLLLLVDRSLAEDRPGGATKPAARPERYGSVGMSDMAQAATELHAAGDAFERFAIAGGALAKSIARSLATMSSEFDPFGYETAFRTIGEQAEMLRQQHKIIQELQQREINRLRNENRKLRRKLELSRERR